MYIICPTGERFPVFGGEKVGLFSGEKVLVVFAHNFCCTETGQLFGGRVPQYKSQLFCFFAKYCDGYGVEYGFHKIFGLLQFCFCLFAVANISDVGNDPEIAVEMNSGQGNFCIKS